jgi:hypothetical protein
MNQKNSTSPQENTNSFYTEITQLYEKQAKEIFSLEKKDEEFSLLKKSYDKYFKQSQENMESLDLEKVEEECERLEKEIENKSTEVEEHEQKIKSLFLDCGVYNKLLAEEILSKSEFDKMSEILQNKVKLSEEKITVLKSQSPRSTKKIFSDYLNHDDSQSKIIRESLKVEVKENLRLKNLHQEKFSNLEKKRMIYEENMTKVTLKESNLKDLREKLCQLTQGNEIVLEEIKSLDLNISQVEDKLKFLETQVQVKKPQPQVESNLSKVKKNCYYLKLDQETDSNSNLTNKKLISENFSYQREIENHQMILEDYYTLVQKKNENATIFNEKRCNILSMTGIMMNCLSLKKKSAKVKKISEETKTHLRDYDTTFNSLEEVKKIEAEIYDTAEKLRNFKESITKMKLSQKKRQHALLNTTTGKSKCKF